MKIGVVGVGKLAGPIFEEVAKTHDVVGFDIAERWPEQIRMQDTLRPLLDCDLVFVAVQTPHTAEYEGVTRLPASRSDFDYSYLTGAIQQLASAGSSRPPLVVISTVLPGTIEREIVPLWDGPVLYNPFFIAMGTEVADFLDPEFVLIGFNGERGAETADLSTFYLSLGLLERVVYTGYREAELAKMAYNTWISAKIALANTIGELSHKLGIDTDAVTSVLKQADRRIVSTAYMDAGMGDGGPCHPRDCIALSWLARQTGMSFDLFSAVMEQREAHAGWLADLVQDASHRVPLHDRDGFEQYLPVTVLGRAYKPESRLETGSAGLLVAGLLRERGVEVSHVEDLP